MAVRILTAKCPCLPNPENFTALWKHCGGLDGDGVIFLSPNERPGFDSDPGSSGSGPIISGLKTFIYYPARKGLHVCEATVALFD